MGWTGHKWWDRTRSRTKEPRWRRERKREWDGWMERAGRRKRFSKMRIVVVIFGYATKRSEDWGEDGREKEGVRYKKMLSKCVGERTRGMSRDPVLGSSPLLRMCDCWCIYSLNRFFNSVLCSLEPWIVNFLRTRNTILCNNHFPDPFIFFLVRMFYPRSGSSSSDRNLWTFSPKVCTTEIREQISLHSPISFWKKFFAVRTSRDSPPSRASSVFPCFSFLTISSSSPLELIRVVLFVYLILEWPNDRTSDQHFSRLPLLTKRV